MKTYHILLAICLLSVACNKKDTEGVITKTVTPVYPVITLSGEPVVSTGVGGTYTDPGASVFDTLDNSTKPLTPTSNNVDLTTPGFYAVNFNAKNLYGYRASATRLILVTQDDPADDISGVYHRTSNGQEVNITKAGTGLFIVDNPGGVLNNPAFISDYYIGFTVDANTFEGPTQDSPNGSITLGSPKIVRSGSTITLSWVVLGAAFGTATRTFVKN